MVGGLGAKGGIAAERAAVRAAVEKACVAAGGKLESMYYAFGGIDAYVIADLPNNTAAAALALAVNQAGGASVNTVVLMTVAEVDELHGLTKMQAGARGDAAARIGQHAFDERLELV